jgi:hypothetical protein
MQSANCAEATTDGIADVTLAVVPFVSTRRVCHGSVGYLRATDTCAVRAMLRSSRHRDHRNRGIVITETAAS